ncbi:MAG TPA: HmuY family protein [Oligoflexus sp.]|uniref:HmuY family protein n=1 Tax=Oligoflexus sp. TaxID=1971216 RepID=UPI002D460AF7|nr:HmuY family protein [Oligoflexus sp.]HYX35484.1 HmuY family protein [Oligoflexus sp.]
MNRCQTISLILALGLVGCAQSKDKSDPVQEESAFTPLEAAGQTQAIEVDATSRTDWVGFDFDSATFIAAADLSANSSWDLAFKRTSIKMNGANVKMQVITKDFAAIDVAPKEGYEIDQPSTDPAAVETTGLAFHKDPAWYAYDINTHVVSSRGLVYGIETNEGRHFKLKILDYYNAARLPAYLNFEFQELKEVEP